MRLSAIFSHLSRGRKEGKEGRKEGSSLWACELVSHKSRVASRRVHVDHSGNRWCVYDEPLDTCVRHNNRCYTRPDFTPNSFSSSSLLLEWLAWLTFQLKKMRIGEEPGYFSIRSRWLFVLITSASTLNSSLLATQSELNFCSLPFEHTAKSSTRANQERKIQMNDWNEFSPIPVLFLLVFWLHFQLTLESLRWLCMSKVNIRCPLDLQSVKFA